LYAADDIERCHPCSRDRSSGFIGFHLARRFLADGWHVLGIDNLNDYYDPRLKRARVRELKDQSKFLFQRCDIADRAAMAKLFAAHRFNFVVHLAAQAGFVTPCNIRMLMRIPISLAS